MFKHLLFILLFFAAPIVFAGGSDIVKAPTHHAQVSYVALGQNDQNIVPWYLSQPSCVIGRGNPGKSGEYNGTLVGFHNILWKMPVGKTNSIILCYNNKVFLSGMAFDVNTGKPAWSAPKLELNQQYSDLGWTIYKDHLYTAIESLQSLAASRTIGIYDIDLHNNTLQKLHLPIRFDKYLAVNILAYQNMLYISSLNGIVAYSISRKRTTWSYPFHSSFSIQMATDGKNLFATTNKGLVAINLLSGKIVWSHDNVGLVAPMVKGGTVYLARANSVIALNSSTGSLLWEYEDAEKRIAPLNLTFYDGNIVFDSAGANQGLTAINSINGQLVWELQGGEIWQPISQGSFLYSVTYPQDYDASLVQYSGLQDKVSKSLIKHNQISTGLRLGYVIPYGKYFFATGLDEKSNTYLIAIN